jgi:hypothetical protein
VDVHWTWLRRWLHFGNTLDKEAREEADSVQAAEEIRARHAFYHDIAQARLRAQNEYITSIDNKTTSYFTIGSTVLAIVAALATSDSELIEACTVAEITLFLGLAFYVCMAGCYVWSLLPGKSAESPDMEQWRSVGLTSPIESLCAALGDSYVEAYQQNEPGIEKKAFRSAGALWFLFLEVVCLAVSVLAPFWPPW